MFSRKHQQKGAFQAGGGQEQKRGPQNRRGALKGSPGQSGRWSQGRPLPPEGSCLTGWTFLQL